MNSNNRRNQKQRYYDYGKDIAEYQDKKMGIKIEGRIQVLIEINEIIRDMKGKIIENSKKTDKME